MPWKESQAAAGIGGLRLLICWRRRGEAKLAFIRLETEAALCWGPGGQGGRWPLLGVAKGC